MRIDDLPGSMLVLGGGYIGAEMSHVFGALGTRITIVHRGDELLPSQDREVRHRFTAAYRDRFDLRLATTVERVEPTSVGLVAHLVARDGARSSIEVETMLVAIGRVPNTDQLDARAGGLELDEHGHIRSDDTYATNLPNVWALGDTTNHYQLKHMANAEARLVQHNITHADAPRRAKFPFVPAAVFADPQVATVGATEDELDRAGRTYRVAVREYSTTAYGWAMEDTTSFVKVLCDPATGLLLGAHIMGAQAATLIQPLIQAMSFGNTVEQVARELIYIHPALTEVVENALLDLL
jgi:mycothione reductase